MCAKVQPLRFNGKRMGHADKHRTVKLVGSIRRCTADYHKYEGGNNRKGGLLLLMPVLS